jgi:hypothetical protein
MRKSAVLSLGLVVVAVLAAAVLFLRSQRSSSEVSANPNPVATPIPTETTATAKELQFENVIVVEARRLVVDGKALPEFSCDQTPFASLRLSSTLTAELICREESTGGVSIVIKGGETLTEDLSALISEEGNQADVRSWITKRGAEILIRRASLNSTEDAENPGPVDCSKSAEILSFDEAKRQFKKTRIDFNPDSFDFEPPINIDERCLAAT